MRPTLILGGNGKTGRRVADRLEQLGVPVRRASRGTVPAFDWRDRATWHAALAGMGAVYITYAPDIALPGAVEAIAAFTQVAMDAGVRRLVLLSGRGEEDAQRAEAVLQNSDVDWTIVRASWFAQNFSEGFFADDIRRGMVYWPRPDVLEPFIDIDDIADIVAAALTDDRHIARLYEVTGPRLLTFRDAIGEIAEAVGKPVSVVEVPVPDYLEGAIQAGVPRDYVDLLGLLVSEVLDGRNSHVTKGVDEALGRPAREFRTFVAGNKGAWL